VSERAKTYAEVEEETTQRLLGALVARYGWTLDQENDARILAFVALAPVRTLIEANEERA